MALAECLDHSGPRSDSSVLLNFSTKSDDVERGQSPRPAKKPQDGGYGASSYFFFPWFLTASIAAAAASGSRYVPPGFTGVKSASSS